MIFWNGFDPPSDEFAPGDTGLQVGGTDHPDVTT
jgi:hypothetical protein